MATPAALPPLPFNPARVRTYLVRLPLFTRLVLLAILVFWLLELQTVWAVVQWGSLVPDDVWPTQSNAYPPYKSPTVL